MRLKVPFPGIMNDLKAEFPVKIVSGMHPPGTRPWDGPPPELDLPPYVCLTYASRWATNMLASEYFASASYDARDEKD